MTPQQNSVIAEMLAQYIEKLECADTIVLSTSGPKGSINKTFSHTLPQDMDIVKKHLNSCLSELESAWNPDEEYIKRTCCCAIELDFDPPFHEKLAAVALEEIAKDKDALVNYIVNKILKEKCQKQEQLS